ncbi:hypothetical protein HPB51_023031 [Rhipicephalus microplus]|uniref:Uncharacterized protein n=1 Tax=Rhipicephalus microplus TaxID=6941 RepID=A0A9J6D874_RHIMP|nr:hypothetical protein HPB51_023031 [Rhipicephalus microplus]
MVLERGEDCSSEGILAGPPATKRSSRAYKILRSITTMRDCLLSRRRDYVKYVLCTLSPESCCATVDWERWRTDRMVEQFARNVRAEIEDFSAQKNSNGLQQSLQACQHRMSVRSLLLDYLATTCLIYAEMKAAYVKRVCDRQRWSRLCSPYRSLGPSSSGGHSSLLPGSRL